MSWLPRRMHQPLLALPQTVAKQIPAKEKILGYVPTDATAQHWLIAGKTALYQLHSSAEVRVEQAISWDRFTKAAWDAQKRTFTFYLLHDPAPKTVHVPASLSSDTKPFKTYRVDETAFAKAVRQQIESAIVYFITRTLSNGVKVTGAIRRNSEGELYTTLEPSPTQADLNACQNQLQELLEHLHDSVGLTTGDDFLAIKPK